MTNELEKLSFEDFSVVDLFCGIGGLTHGFVLENFKVDAGIDSDESCEFAYKTNNKTKFVPKKVENLTAQEVNNLFTKKKILVGCAPCQPFSLYNHKISKDEQKQKENTKWNLLSSFADLIEEIEPEIISMENVPQLVKFNDGKVFNTFKERLEKKNYKVTFSIVNAKNYGVPQRRKRLILFGSKYGEIKLVDKFIEDDKPKTVREAIGDLPSVEDGISHPNDPIHRARKLSSMNKRRIQATEEGGFWRDWDEDLKLECHKKETGKDFFSVYGRMKWDDVSPTITTHCIGLNNGRFGHPTQDRAITLREASLLQGFPKDYEFIESIEDFNSANLARHIGNAVPVGLGIAIARSIKNHIEEIG